MYKLQTGIKRNFGKNSSRLEQASENIFLVPHGLVKAFSVRGNRRYGRRPLGVFLYSCQQMFPFLLSNDSTFKP